VHCKYFGLGSIRLPLNVTWETDKQKTQPQTQTTVTPKKQTAEVQKHSCTRDLETDVLSVVVYSSAVFWQ